MSAVSGYCEVNDVERILGLVSGYFTLTSKPSVTDVQNTISDMVDYIDDWTQFSWKESQANEGQWEYHTLGRIGVRGSWFVWLGYPVFLKYRQVRQFDKTKDNLEVFNGNAWEDWLSTKTEGIGADFWVDYDNGIIFFRGLWVYLGLKEYVMRTRYRYGATSVPNQIRLACAYLTASQLVTTNDKTFLLPEGGTSVVIASEKVRLWETKAHDILDRQREWVVAGG
jgi:hypothetical protein